jgi:acetyl-CoA C-acetyltransferase
MGPDGPLSGSTGWRERYGTEEISQFRAADLIADKWGIGRPEMERYALASHQRAVRAIDPGAFGAEIVPYQVVARDDGPRRDTTLGKMAALKPLREGGRITAALSSQIADGAAALLIASSRAVREHGLRPGPGSPTCPPAATITTSAIPSALCTCTLIASLPEPSACPPAPPWPSRPRGLT